MSNAGQLALFTCAAYLLGSIPFGVLLAKLRGIDIREVGSGNIGATNVARTTGKGLGLIVLILDASKGALLLTLDLHVLSPGLHEWIPSTVLLIGIAPVLGHCYSPWLRFAGGKGVATSLGVVLASSPLVAACAVILFAVIYALTKVVSLASLSTAIVVPLLYYVLDFGAEFVLLTALMAVVIFVQHRSNIGRLLRGRELEI